MPDPDRRQLGKFKPLAGHRLQAVGLLVEQQDAELLGADQVDDDLEDDLGDFLEIEGGVQLEGGDVEIGEHVVLFLDLHVAIGEILVLLFDPPDPAENLLLLPL